MPIRRVKLTRRDFIAGGIGTLAGAALTLGVPSYLRNRRRIISGQIMGASSKVGHLLNGMSLGVPTERIQTEYLIVGGGISGLTAAYRFEKKGIRDYLLLDLEDEVGGSSRGGSNSVSAYPWGAHYVPIPAPESKSLIQFFNDVGVIEGFSKTGLPIYKEEYLSQDPQERVFASGQWQEGLIPKSELTFKDQAQFSDFFSYMNHLRTSVGHDQKRLFSIPVDESSSDLKTRALDQISMAAFMRDQKWDSKPLLTYVNYCCRDDFGAGLEQVSAWAGVHYFASRDGAGANTVKGNVLTWPEGNSWLVKKLTEKTKRNFRTGSLVYRIGHEGLQPFADFLDVKSNKTYRVLANTLVYSAPRFTAKKVFQVFQSPESLPPYFSNLEYSPWMVANLTLNSQLEQKKGAPLSWDNTLYESQSLGYVNAGNQKIERYPSKNVLTYYWPLSHLSPQKARQEALGKSFDSWAGEIMDDLSTAHPDLTTRLDRMDVWLWGHGMIRPTVGFIWGQARQEMKKNIGSVYFAHTDMSGVSLFEEGFYQGSRAADLALRSRS